MWYSTNLRRDWSHDAPVSFNQERGALNMFRGFSQLYPQRLVDYPFEPHLVKRSTPVNLHESQLAEQPQRGIVPFGYPRNKLFHSYRKVVRVYPWWT